MWLFFFCNTIQLITIKLCTKFQNPKPSSCCEILARKKSIQTNRQTNKQTNIVTEKAKTIYPLYTSYLGYKYFMGITIELERAEYSLFFFGTSTFGALTSILARLLELGTIPREK